ncbi:cofactor assembly of complex C subunit B [Kovacikia minuta]|uniref:cofactor assembly of complex C subunit B n=1 Tax=Kovacikia minuta TaxID=2931930 RepID=UPI0020C7DA6B
MVSSVLLSTFLLTLLLAVGLLFFIRASVKDRTESVRLMSEQPEESIWLQLQQYFTQRAYRVQLSDAENHQVMFGGGRSS